MNVLQYVKQIKKTIGDFKPKFAIVLGSGLSEFLNNVNVFAEIPFSMINGFPRSTVVGHEGKFVFGKLGNADVVVIKGRLHYYEGYSMTEVVLPIHVVSLLGAEVLFLTNACGGVNKDFVTGTVMAITSHINLAPNPLIDFIKSNDVGVTFQDMTQPYDEKIISVMEKVSNENVIELKQGVYLQFTGPSYESPAEVTMARVMGADVCGMSTACEAVFAKYLGLKVAGISLVANAPLDICKEEITHEKVVNAFSKKQFQVSTLITKTIEMLRQ